MPGGVWSHAHTLIISNFQHFLEFKSTSINISTVLLCLAQQDFMRFLFVAYIDPNTSG